MTPLVAIVGKSHSGKTTIMVGVITELRRRGYRVASIKHSSQTIDIDQPGKDTWKFAEAGSDTIFISTPGKVALIKNTDHDLDILEMMHLMGSDFDVILVEGYHKSHLPKIEVVRTDFGLDLLCPVQELSAVITDKPLNTGKPEFGTKDIEAITDFIENNFIIPAKGDTMLFVNDQPVVMNRFVKDVVTRVATGLVSALSDIGELRDIDILIRKLRK